MMKNNDLAKFLAKQSGPEFRQAARVVGRVDILEDRVRMLTEWREAAQNKEAALRTYYGERSLPVLAAKAWDLVEQQGQPHATAEADELVEAVLIALDAAHGQGIDLVSLLRERLA